MSEGPSWLRWPTNSPDPALNAAIAVLLVSAFIFGVIILGVVAIPIAIVLVIGKLWHAHLNRPMPTEEMFAKTQERVVAAAFPDTQTFARMHAQRMMEYWQDQLPPETLLDSMFAAVQDLYRQEDLDNNLPPYSPTFKNTIEEGRFRDQLLERVRKIQEPNETLALIQHTLGDAMDAFANRLPPMVRTTLDGILNPAPPPFATLPLIDLIADVPTAVEALLTPFFAHDVVEKKLFLGLRIQIASSYGIATDDKPFVMPTKFKGTPRQIVDTYLRHTPLHKFFDVPIPFDVPLSRRMEHTVIVAGSGWGKTQLLQTIIANDLEQPEPHSMIVLDSTGAMVDRIQRLALFDDRLRDRILIIDPAHSPALNMFDVSTPRFERYTDDQKEDVQTEIIGLFNYIFASDDYDLTSRQGGAFTYAVRLILSRPGSTITDLRRLLEEPAPKNASDGYQRSSFREDIDKLDADTRDFFTHHFFTKAFESTRLQIAQRLHKVVGVPAFRRMFTASTNAIDFFDGLQKGVIYLVNTNQQLLKEDSYVLFGRYIIARALAAAFERATVSEANRKPAFLIIDEAAPYFDKTFESLLTRVRQFRLGVVIAFQHLEQAPEKLRSAIASSTSVKYAGGLGFADRRWLAREMETTPEFVGAQKKDSAEPPRWTQFACYVRNYTDSAVSLTVPFLRLERMQKMSDPAYSAMMERNLQRVAPIVAPNAESPPVEQPPPEPESPTKEPRKPRKSWDEVK